jgi:hypothetical protein
MLKEEIYCGSLVIVEFCESGFRETSTFFKNKNQ